MSLGPLTTPFAPAPGCNDTIYGLIHTEGTATHKYHSLGLPETKQCYPSGFAPDAYYSPGICPSHWTSACGSLETIGALTETRVNCCPVGFICVTTQQDPWSTLSCSRYYTDAPMVKVPQSGGDGHTFYMETTLGPGMVAFANDVRVRYQNTDFSTPTPTPTERSSSPASDVTSRFPPNEAPGSSVSGDAAAGNAGALSKTAYAGIGVAVAAVLVTLLAGFLVLARRRKEMRDSVPADAAELRDEWTRLQMLEMENAIPPQEMGLERGVAEVRGDVVASGELDGRRVAWELG